MRCEVQNCNSANQVKKHEFIGFHRFPANEDKRREWILAIGQSPEAYKKFWRVCSKHFAPDCYFYNGESPRNYLSENAKPTLNLKLQCKAIEGLKRSSHTDTCETNLSKLEQNPGSPEMKTAHQGTSGSLKCKNLSTLEQNPGSQEMKTAAHQGTRGSLKCKNLSTLEQNPGSQEMKTAHQGTSGSLKCKNLSKLEQNPGPQVMKTAHQETSGSLKCQGTFAETSKGAIMEAVYKGRIDKLEKKIKNLETLAKNRLLRLNSLKQKNRRLNKTNSNLNLKLLEMLEKETVYKRIMLEKEKVYKRIILESVINNKVGGKIFFRKSPV